LRRETSVLGDGLYDVAVIGGGIAGACVAWDASLRGLRVILLDRGDFAGEASSNSLRVVHGGIRYLQTLNVHRARSSFRELTTWLRIAPHFVTPLRVVVPFRKGGTPPLVARAGAILANQIARPEAAAAHLPPVELLGPAAAAEQIPGLDPSALTGGLAFDDGRLSFPDRLVLAIVKAAVAAGARAINYAEVTGSMVRGNRIEALTVRDVTTGATGELRARVVVNAAGGNLERVADRLAPGMRSASAAFACSANITVPSLGPEVAFGLGRDRLFFFVPWRGHTTIGTSHYPVGDHPDPDEMVADLLRQVNDVWPGPRLTQHDVLAVHQGQVLARSAPHRPPRLAEQGFLARHPTIGNLLSVAPPKFTTARATATLAVDRVRTMLGRGLPHGRTDTALLAARANETPAQLRASIQARTGGRIPEDVLDYTMAAYGTEAEVVLDGAPRSPHGLDRVVPGAPVVRAHLDYALTHEMAVTPDDILWRRTELGQRGLASAPTRRLVEGLFEAGTPASPIRVVPAADDPSRSCAF